MIDKKRIEILKKRAIIGLICINLMLIGAFFNILTISKNGGKMPVYTNNYFFTSQRHFIFNDSSQVKNFIFTDMMHVIFVNKYEIYFSIGDAIIYGTGIPFLIYCMVIFIKDIIYLTSEFKKKKIIHKVIIK